MDNKTKGRIINALRRVSRFAPNKSIAKVNSRIRLEIGKTKKGKPKYKVLYKCAKCKGLFNSNEVHMDHISPVVDPKVGFVDWNSYISRLFCPPEGYQTLCIEDHENKTLAEAEIRKITRKKKKLKKIK